MISMIPALVLGMAAGFTTGAWAAGSLDTTPYGETDLNTASRDARQAGSTEGWQLAQRAADRATARLREANAEHVGQLESKLAQMRRAQSRSEKKAARKQAALTRLHGSLAETTAALKNATRSGAAAGPDGHTVEGALRSTWILGSKEKPWPQDCAQPLRSYQVRVTAGSGATVATARLVDSEARRVEDKKRDVLTLSCRMTYTATLPTPLGGGYRFAVAETADPETPVYSSPPVPGAALEDQAGPGLTVTRRVR